ncbi:hypothetical protein HDU76_010586 [Blyttiomyces sp. JEL0837]|nr:hypothetical protein HDU76_010586 [Blyttiomyces sp. JEL0837]
MPSFTDIIFACFPCLHDQSSSSETQRDQDDWNVEQSPDHQSYHQSVPPIIRLPPRTIAPPTVSFSTSSTQTEAIAIDLRVNGSDETHQKTLATKETQTSVNGSDETNKKTFATKESQTSVDGSAETHKTTVATNESQTSVNGSDEAHKTTVATKETQTESVQFQSTVEVSSTSTATEKDLETDEVVQLRLALEYATSRITTLTEQRDAANTALSNTEQALRDAQVNIAKLSEESSAAHQEASDVGKILRQQIRRLNSQNNIMARKVQSLEAELQDKKDKLSCISRHNLRVSRGNRSLLTALEEQVKLTQRLQERLDNGGRPLIDEDWQWVECPSPTTSDEENEYMDDAEFRAIFKREPWMRRNPYVVVKTPADLGLTAKRSELPTGTLTTSNATMENKPDISPSPRTGLTPPNFDQDAALLDVADALKELASDLDQEAPVVLFADEAMAVIPEIPDEGDSDETSDSDVYSEARGLSGLKMGQEGTENLTSQRELSMAPDREGMVTGSTPAQFSSEDTMTEFEEDWMEPPIVSVQPGTISLPAISVSTAKSQTEAIGIDLAAKRDPTESAQVQLADKGSSKSTTTENNPQLEGVVKLKLALEKATATARITTLTQTTGDTAQNELYKAKEALQEAKIVIDKLSVAKRTEEPSAHQQASDVGHLLRKQICRLYSENHLMPREDK